ncbi:GTP 3',8-cyclase MoaA [Celerinatantimonas diazotrophica]|uniref:Cyclic pyranopterin monophosphate synthase subunit MoaA n=1 Tax=Celerinatantimonas diazotrophica TaxID=412034 RepID=A0A4R1JBQ7_9GAMM|nr:GTP 3',8-cyclase MoaA [Celerinatantimonas diazotrophica]TCK47589.1 cyclic pyranopterin monophosphate synthase subunit MoaA [Celerinatantimonas diazotrophica]CAG9296788.1 GTP 3',8-cyclase [Celerinatantimonas diazotrophica]
MFIDNFNRRFSYLRLSVTDVCNFKCQYCLPDGYQRPSQMQQFLSLDEIDKLVTTFAQSGTSKIRITGGEPTLRRDIEQIIECCSAPSQIHTVAMTTNGYRLSNNAKCWKDAGLSRVNISIDSFDERLFNQITGTNRYSKVIEGIESAIDCGLQVKLNTVLMNSYNFHQFEHNLERLKQWPVELRYIELMETLEQRQFFEQEHISGERLKQFLIRKGWRAQTRENAAGPAQVFSHPDYQGRVGLILPYERNFCDSCNRLRISATGKLHLCLFGEHGYDLRPHLGDNDSKALKDAIHRALDDKLAGHHLHDRNPGQTIHLASVGG